MIGLDFCKRMYEREMRRQYEKNNILDATSIVRPHTFLLKCRIGYHSGCNNRCSLSYTDIGNYTQLGQFVRVNPRDHIYQNFMISDDIYDGHEEVFDKGLKEFDGYEVKIGHDVWIGDRAMILSHVEIGNGAVIAAGSVVTRSVMPYMVVGGVPARFVKWRFPKAVREELEKTQWFRWPIEKVLEERKRLEKTVGFDMERYRKEYCFRKPDLKDGR